MRVIASTLNYVIEKKQIAACFYQRHVYLAY